MDARPKWDVQLLGLAVDPEGWADVLKQPFDPWVARNDNAFVLRWSGFDGLVTASDVQERGAFVVDQLSGAMWIDRATRPVRFKGIVAFKPDGTRHTTVKFATAHLEARSRATATGTVIRSDGTTVPPPALTEAEGGEVVLIDLLRGHSTSALVERSCEPRGR